MADAVRCFGRRAEGQSKALERDRPRAGSPQRRDRPAAHRLSRAVCDGSLVASHFTPAMKRLFLRAVRFLLVPRSTLPERATADQPTGRPRTAGYPPLAHT